MLLNVLASDLSLITADYSSKHQWSSGRIVPCHGTDPGSIPGCSRAPSSDRTGLHNIVLNLMKASNFTVMIQTTIGPYQNTAWSWYMMSYALLGGQYRNTDPPAMFML
ncbi:hypothetical protein F2Q69_00011847 [Brassica cretica]|uniref:Uncharacterized protein n=1 Tax=Brassica cretica TaxID=69181 RepID=A0A8S9QWP8_BRACR|nr:hypothetical protein F2Q69_00011847 [Brassica cretica]